MRAVIDTVICWISRANTRSGRGVAHNQSCTESQHRPKIVSGSCRTDTVYSPVLCWLVRMKSSFGRVRPALMCQVPIQGCCGSALTRLRLRLCYFLIISNLDMRNLTNIQQAKLYLNKLKRWLGIRKEDEDPIPQVTMA